jgi:peptidoglycan/LPS O-acetylase OafA/YrhL
MFNNLRRITQDGRWIPEIDSLRFIAIFSVLLFHLNLKMTMGYEHLVQIQPRYSLLAYVLGNCDRGVRLFFVISGFILGLPFARQWLLMDGYVSLRKYFVRRVSRLEPPYILSYLFACLLIGLISGGKAITSLYLKHIVAGIAYLNTIIYHGLNPVNMVTWSLEIEIQFYVMAPVLATLFRIRNTNIRRGAMLLLMASCGVLQAAFMQHNFVAQSSIAYYLQYFLSGFLLADIYLLYLKGRSGLWWDAIGVAGWIVYFLVPSSPWTHALFPFLLLVLCATALCSRYLSVFYANPTIAIIGGMCYSIYLLHLLLINAFFKITHHLILQQDYLISLLMQIVFAGLPIMLICAMYYAWIERFFMDPHWPEKISIWWLSWRRHPVEVFDD